MKFYRHTPLRAWVYLLIGTLLLLGPWLWPLLLFRSRDWADFSRNNSWGFEASLLLGAWMLAQSCAGLLLIALAFCVRPRPPA